jgi:carboxymethylenebutenolidase
MGTDKSYHARARFAASADEEEATMANVRTEEVQIDVEGKKMPAFLALPEGEGPRPAIIVFEEIFGINAHMRDVTQRLAGEGYVAIAPDYHHRAWAYGTQLGYSAEERQQGMAVIPKLTLEGLLADIDATVAYLKTRKEARGDKLGAIGFCIGGHVAFLAAALRPFRATASFYGGGIATFGPGGGPKTVERSGGIKGRILALFGGQDPMIPADQVATIRKALEEHRVRHEVVVYDDASHAFFCEVAVRGSYNEKAAKDAWERVKRLFKEELG